MTLCLQASCSSRTKPIQSNESNISLDWQRVIIDWETLCPQYEEKHSSVCQKTDPTFTLMWPPCCCSVGPTQRTPGNKTQDQSLNDTGFLILF